MLPPSSAFPVEIRDNYRRNYSLTQNRSHTVPFSVFLRARGQKCRRSFQRLQQTAGTVREQKTTCHGGYGGDEMLCTASQQANSPQPTRLRGQKFRLQKHMRPILNHGSASKEKKKKESNRAHKAPRRAGGPVNAACSHHAHTTQLTGKAENFPDSLARTLGHVSVPHFFVFAQNRQACVKQQRPYHEQSRTAENRTHAVSCSGALSHPESPPLRRCCCAKRKKLVLL